MFFLHENNYSFRYCSHARFAIGVMFHQSLHLCGSIWKNKPCYSGKQGFKYINQIYLNCQLEMLLVVMLVTQVLRRIY